MRLPPGPRSSVRAQPFPATGDALLSRSLCLPVPCPHAALGLTARGAGLEEPVRQACLSIRRGKWEAVGQGEGGTVLGNRDASHGLFLPGVKILPGGGERQGGGEGET